MRNNYQNKLYIINTAASLQITRMLHDSYKNNIPNNLHCILRTKLIKTINLHGSERDSDYYFPKYFLNILTIHQKTILKPKYLTP